MEQKTVTATNAAELNRLAAEAMAPAATQTQSAVITAPIDGLVNLPGGLVLASGEVIKTAEVRELTGRDEEALSKITSFGKLFNAILSRAVVKLGDRPVDEPLLDQVLAGDRDELLLGIYKVTFGQIAELQGYCQTCNEYKPVGVDVDTDIKRKVLIDPVNDKYFKVQGKKNEYTIVLPSGVTTKELVNNEDKNMAELSTILLGNAVLEINGSVVISKTQVQNLPLLDRRKISEEIAKRNPGPQFDDITLECTDCEGEVVVPINLGALFRL